MGPRMTNEAITTLDPFDVRLPDDNDGPFMRALRKRHAAELAKEPANVMLDRIATLERQVAYLSDQVGKLLTIIEGPP